MSPVDVVDAQVIAYNAQDLEAFCACFAEDCVLADLNGAAMFVGLPAIRERYEKLFAEYPENRARIVNRVAVGDVVVDHEDITRSPTLRINAIAIYTVRNQKIARVDFVREP